MIIKLILLLFIAFAVFRLFKRYSEKAIVLRWLILWLAFWLAAAAVVLMPELTTRVAAIVGVGRGADLAIYLAILGLYYLLFRVMVKLERVEKDISKIVEEVAIRDWKDKK